MVISSMIIVSMVYSKAAGSDILNIATLVAGKGLELQDGPTLRLNVDLENDTIKSLVEKIRKSTYVIDRTLDGEFYLRAFIHKGKDYLNDSGYLKDIDISPSTIAFFSYKKD